VAAQPRRLLCDAGHPVRADTPPPQPHRPGLTGSLDTITPHETGAIVDAAVETLLVTTDAERAEAYGVRQRVFVAEQGVPAEI